MKMLFLRLGACAALACVACVVFSREIRHADQATKRQIIALSDTTNQRLAIIAQQTATMLAEERITDLPEDGQVWYVSLCVRPNWQTIPEDRRLVAAFEVDPHLVSLKAQTRYHFYTANDPLFKERFAGVTEFPCLMIQNGSGQVVFKRSGSAAAQSERRLAKDIQAAFTDICKNGRCCPAPRPPAAPVNLPPSPPQVITDTSIPADDDWVTGAAIVSGIIAFLGAIVFMWRREKN